MMGSFIRNFVLMYAVMFWQGVSVLYSQNENRISMIASVKKDTIILRWAPSSVPTWQVGINSGYIIKKYIIARDGNFIADGLSKGILLTDAPIKPESNDYFEKLSNTNKYALIVQEAIYGKEFRPPVTADFISLSKAYEELEVRFGFALFMCDLSPEIAKAAGLIYVDTDVSENERYVYSITPVDIPDGLQIEPAAIVVDADNVTELPPVSGIQAIFLDKAVTFRWPVVFHKGLYTAYIIEKSQDGKIYLPVSDLPLVNLSEEDKDYFIYTDSLLNNDQKYFYRIRGISPFGQTGPFSAIIEGKGIPDFSAYATIDTAVILENNRIKIQWRVTENSASPVISVNVLRSDRYDGSFEIINNKPLDARSRNYTDLSPGNSNYYQVRLTGKDNLQSSSFPYFIQIEDNDPPAIPENITGKVDSSGIVSIVWKNNSEPDLQGYKIFRGNSPDDEFIALNQEITRNNFCCDTINLNSLSTKIYYRVVAIDNNYNSSDYSALLELSRPDTIAPAPATINRISVKAGKVMLELEGSPSKDVSHYELHLKAESDTTSFTIASWSRLPFSYEDSPTVRDLNLQYTLCTFDNNGNKSSIERVVFIPQESSKNLIVTGDQSPDGSMVNISWMVPKDFMPVKTYIYRSTGNGPVSLYVTIENSEQYFSDRNIEINTRYNYRILLYNAAGTSYTGKLTVNPSLNAKNQ